MVQTLLLTILKKILNCLFFLSGFISVRIFCCCFFFLFLCNIFPVYLSCWRDALLGSSLFLYLPRLVSDMSERGERAGLGYTCKLEYPSVSELRRHAEMPDDIFIYATSWIIRSQKDAHISVSGVIHAAFTISNQHRFSTEYRVGNILFEVCSIWNHHSPSAPTLASLSHFKQISVFWNMRAACSCLFRMDSQLCFCFCGQAET